MPGAALACAEAACYPCPIGRGGTVHTKRSVVQSWARACGRSALLGVIVLAGCTTSPDIRLRNPQTGQVFTCSGESGTTGRWWDEMAKRTRDNCVKDLEGRGYVIIE